MKRKDIEIGDLVKIKDGSYAVRVDKYEPHPNIGLCKNLYKVKGFTPNQHLITRGNIPEQVHDVFIENTVTGAVYLHSAAFLDLAVCPCCGRS